jgi:hypothetical protein
MAMGIPAAVAAAASAASTAMAMAKGDAPVVTLGGGGAA